MAASTNSRPASKSSNVPPKIEFACNGNLRRLVAWGKCRWKNAEVGTAPRGFRAGRVLRCQNLCPKRERGICNREDLFNSAVSGHGKTNPCRLRLVYSHPREKPERIGGDH